jgi:pimeloyl-ACP methyl ester carboxylesterase
LELAPYDVSALSSAFRRHGLTLLVALAAIAASAGCAKKTHEPLLGELYNQSAMEHDAEVRPVIVIPGILGSRLQDDATSTEVWGAFSGKYANPEKPAGARLIALPMQQGVPLRELRDEVRPDGALDRVRFNLLGLPIALSAYAQILRTLGVGGYRDETLGTLKQIDYGSDHFTCFQFDYDWRRDNVENAQSLARFIEEKQLQVAKSIRQQYGVERRPEDIKFDIVAHSMGGMVARYYLRYGDAGLPDDGTVPEATWAGARNIGRLVLIGTPSGGSVLALQQLVEGKEFAFFLPEAPAAVLGTMPSIYQLMPRTRHARVVDEKGRPIDIYDIEVWKRYNWGLAGDSRALRHLLPNETSQRRREIALDHLAKCLARADQFQRAIDSPDPAPGTTIEVPAMTASAASSAALTPIQLPEIHLFTGDAVRTAALLEVSPGGRLRVARREAGDGTVTRASALLDERLDGEWSHRLRTPIAWHSTTFLFEDHLGLTRATTFSDNVLHLLLERSGRPVVRRAAGGRVRSGRGGGADHARRGGRERGASEGFAGSFWVAARAMPRAAA